MSISVGSIEGTITLKDQYTATARDITAETLRIKAASDELARSIGVPFKTAERAIKQSEGERTKLLADYKRLASGLDPVERKTQQYDRAVDTLTRSLKAGIITQETYNLRLVQTKSHLDDNIHWTRRLGTEIGSSLKSNLGSYLAVGAAISLIGGTLVSVAKQTITANIEAEASARKVESAIERYGTRAGITVQDINELASAQSRLTGIDDELIAESAALALKFNRLSGDEIPRLVRVAQDMAEVTGMDLPAAMQKAGAYVNLPQQALTKLRKEGYAVSAGQEKLIKDMLRAGDVAGAQAEIFKILEAQYGGAAEAARDTLGGALTALGTAWENMLEEVGQDRLGPLRQGIEDLIELLQEAPTYISAFAEAWNGATISVNSFLIAINKLSLGAATRNPLAFLNPAGAAESARIAEENINRLQKSTNQIVAGRVSSFYKEIAAGFESHRKAARGADEQTAAEEKLAGALKSTRDEWQKLLELAANAVLASQDELINTQALLQARKIGTDAMKLEQAVQVALAKARAAGKAATSAQRLEIIRNTVAVFQAKNAIEDLGEVEKRTADLFAESNKEMLRQVEILVQLEAATRDLLSASIEINAAQVDTGGAQATATTRERIDYAKEWREAWKTAREAAEQEIGEVKDSLLTVAEQERAIADIRRGILDEGLSHIASLAGGWQQFFSTIGSMFGGFAQKVANTLSQMIQTAQAFQSAGNAIGGQAGSAISSAGPFMAVVGAIVGLQSAEIARTRQRQFTSSATLGIGTGEFDRVGSQGLAVANAVESGLQPLLDLLGRTLRSLPEITIRARADGKEFEAVFNGVLLGLFSSMDAAIDAVNIAAVEYLKRGGALSETMKQVLAQSKAVTSEELLKDLNFAAWYDNLGLGDLAVRFKELFNGLAQSLDDADRLGLSQEKIREDFEAQVLDIEAGVLGLDLSASKALESLNGLSVAMEQVGEQQRAEMQARLEASRRELADLQAGGPRLLDNGRRETQEFFDAAVADLQRNIDRYVDELDKIPAALSDQEIDLGIWTAMERFLQGNARYAEEAAKFARMRVQIEFDLIKLKLIELGKWEQWAAVFNDAFNSALQAAGQEGRAGRGGRGGGAGGGDKQSVNDFITDKRFEQSLYGKGEYARQRAEILKQYDEEIAKAGKDKNLRQELLALRDKELAQLEKEKAAKTVDNFRSFLGLDTPFDDIRKTAQGLIDDIKDSPFGNARKAAMIGRVMAETERQIQRASDAMAAGLLGNLAEYITDESVHNEALKQQAILNYELAMETAKVTYAKLLAEGNMSEATKKVFEDVFGWFDKNKDKLPGGKDWDFGKGGGPEKTKADEIYEKYGIRFRKVADTVDKVDDELNRLAESFKSAKDDIRSSLDDIKRGALGIITPEQGFKAAKTQYEDVLAKADRGELAGFQGISEAARNYIESLKEFSPALAAIELPSIMDALTRLAQASTVKDENVIYTEKFSEFSDRQQKTVEVLQDGLGSMTDIAQGQTVVQNRMLDELTKLRTANQELAARLARLESGEQGNKRSTNG